MSITKDFESRIDLMIPEGYNIVDIDNLLAHTRALEAMLRKYQFDQGGDGDCHECQGDQEHSPDCALAKLLE